MKKPTVFRYCILPIMLQTILYLVASILVLKAGFNADIDIPYLVESKEGRIMLVMMIIPSFLFSLLANLPAQHDKYKKDKHDYSYHQITWSEYLNNHN